MTSDFNEELAIAAREMVEERGVEDTLARAVQMATDIIDNCDLAGISVVRRDGSIETPAASSERLRLIDHLQYEMRQGPCFDALHQDDVVTANDLASDERWPKWGPRIARDIGVRSSVSLRLFTTGEDIGVFNFYARQPNGFTHHDVDEAHVLAAHAAVALASALHAGQYQVALDTRTVIGQATGIIMERFDLSSDRAFDVLKRLSNYSNTKLHTVAARLVETRSLPPSKHTPQRREPRPHG